MIALPPQRKTPGGHNASATLCRPSWGYREWRVRQNPTLSEPLGEPTNKLQMTALRADISLPRAGEGRAVRPRKSGVAAGEMNS